MQNNKDWNIILEQFQAKFGATRNLAGIKRRRQRNGAAHAKEQLPWTKEEIDYITTHSLSFDSLKELVQDFHKNFGNEPSRSSIHNYIGRLKANMGLPKTSTRYTDQEEAFLKGLGSNIEPIDDVF